MNGRLRIDPFSLKDTLESGQFFRVTKWVDGYLVQMLDKAFWLKQRGDVLLYEGVEERFLVRFLRLDDDFETIINEIDRDPIIHRAILTYPGLRLIRQDPWECLLSFLCASAKAIPQIRSIIELLCRAAGKSVVWRNHHTYAFPEPDSVRTPIQLQGIQAGYRAKFLYEACRSTDRGRLLALKDMPYQEARESLMRVLGVGRKVADCILLYSLDFLEAFPIDTWIKKGLRKAYFGGKTRSEKELERFASSHFGRFAGYAQLYLFHYWRHHGVG